jgi:hypothetical protein
MLVSMLIADVSIISHRGCRGVWATGPPYRMQDLRGHSRIHGNLNRNCRAREVSFFASHLRIALVSDAQVAIPR